MPQELNGVLNPTRPARYHLSMPMMTAPKSPTINHELIGFIEVISHCLPFLYSDKLTYVTDQFQH